MEWPTVDQVSEHGDSVGTVDSDRYDWDLPPRQEEEEEEAENHHHGDADDHGDAAGDDSSSSHYGSDLDDEHLQELISDFPEIDEEKLIYRNRNISFFAVRREFRRQKKFKIVDNLYELVCRVNNEESPPLISEIKMSLLASLTILILEIQQHFSSLEHRQIWITIAHKNIAHGINT